MPDLLMWLAIGATVWCVLAVLVRWWIGWNIRRGRYPPPH